MVAVARMVVDERDEEECVVGEGRMASFQNSQSLKRQDRSSQPHVFLGTGRKIHRTWFQT